jgi:alkanesulfonate monooxygenase SsuD/methylene tetrahydromethanopterin reductase-like flavin-dependent oxidoreductase (luciferase family)
MRRLWSGHAVTHDGTYYQFDDVDIHPTPSGGALPIWYCGDSALAVRKTVEYCDGWMPGRIPVKTFCKRIARLDELLAEADREPRPTVGVIPILSPGATREAALASVNWRTMLQTAANSKWEMPDSGAWTTPDDLDGALIAGPADEIAGSVNRYHEAGANHVVFDLRLRFDGWLDHIAFLGEEVLPRLATR